MNQYVRLSAVSIAVALSGCASTGNNPRDPLEGFNRGVFTFNDKVDQYALKPVAQAYRKVTPSFVQTGVGNFFGNLGDVWTGVNNILQGKVGDGMSDFMRFMVNSTLGLAGLLDISSEAGIPKHKEDFGQTLGKWGVGPGPYIVLPLLGSSTIRDTAALPLDFKGDLWSYKYPVRWRNTGTGVRLVDARASVLDASDLIEGAALDRYEFVRDAYLQRRENKVHDGDAPSSRGRAAPGQDGKSGSGKPAEKDDYVPAGPTPESTPTTKPGTAPAGKSSRNEGASDEQVGSSIDGTTGSPTSSLTNGAPSGQTDSATSGAMESMTDSTTQHPTDAGMPARGASVTALEPVGSSVVQNEQFLAVSPVLLSPAH